MKIISKQPSAFLQNLTKSMGGVYADNSKNRKLGRVGRPYDHKKESENKEKTWDKVEDFYKKGSDENKLWNSWYNYQKSGDPSHISDFRLILEKKFPKVSSWKQTSPNTNKAQISALDKSGNIIASIDLSGNKIDLTNLQSFMDKCHNFKVSLVEKTTTLKEAKGPRLDAIIKYSNSDGADGIKVSENATDEEKREAIADFYNEAAEGDAENLDEIIEDALADYVPSK